MQLFVYQSVLCLSLSHNVHVMQFHQIRFVTGHKHTHYLETSSKKKKKKKKKNTGTSFIRQRIQYYLMDLHCI